MFFASEGRFLLILGITLGLIWRIILDVDFDVDFGIVLEVAFGPKTVFLLTPPKYSQNICFVM